MIIKYIYLFIYIYTLYIFIIYIYIIHINIHNLVFEACIEKYCCTCTDLLYLQYIMDTRDVRQK